MKSLTYYCTTLLLLAGHWRGTTAWQRSLGRLHMPYSTSLAIFKENNVPSIPSMGQLGKQQDLKNLVSKYQSDSKRVLEDTVKFPSKFVIKIIGNNDDTFLSDMLRALSTATGIAESDLGHATKTSGNGKHLSITINPMFSNANQIYAAYEIAGKDSRVKFVL